MAKTASIARVDWEARRMLAALGVVACAVATLLTATSAPHAEVTDAGEIDQTPRFASLFALQYAESRLVEMNDDALPAPRLKPRASHAADILAGLSAETSAEQTIVDSLVLADFDVIPEADATAAERKCLAEAIYHEARSESVMGQLAVADVIMNRVADRRYPGTICGVVYQGSERVTGCQFSFTCDGSLDRPLQRSAWDRSDDLAGYVLGGLRQPVAREATHYHATYVDPHWADSLVPTAHIGLHVFYRFKSREDENRPAAPKSF